MQANSICICALKIQHRKNCTICEGNYVYDLPELFKGVTFHGIWTHSINPDISPDCFIPSRYLYLGIWSLTNNWLKCSSGSIKETEICLFLLELANLVQTHFHSEKWIYLFWACSFIFLPIVFQILIIISTVSHV